MVQRHGPPRSRQRGAEQGGGAGGEVRRGRRAGLLLRYVAPDRRGSPSHAQALTLAATPSFDRSAVVFHESLQRLPQDRWVLWCSSCLPSTFSPSSPSPPPSLLRSASRPVPDRVGERPAQHPPPARKRSGRRRRPPGGAHPEAHPARDQGDRACRISKSCHPLNRTPGPYRSLARSFVLVLVCPPGVRPARGDIGGGGRRAGRQARAAVREQAGPRVGQVGVELERRYAPLSRSPSPSRSLGPSLRSLARCTTSTTWTLTSTTRCRRCSRRSGRRSRAIPRCAPSFPG